jgi:hypothetical protein
MPESDQHMEAVPEDNDASDDARHNQNADDRAARRGIPASPIAPEILLRFTSCGRCGLFLSVYRLDHNDDFLKALDEIEGGWLTLPWHPGMRNLIHKCYGARVDIESYFFEGTCRECQRPFSFAELDPDQPALFLIKL